MIKFLLGLVLLLPVKSFALLTVLDTGEIIESGKYKLGIQLQGITDEPGGINFAGHVYLPINSAWNLRLHAGTGQTEFNAGGGVKWIPIPDINHQPAIGAIMEVEWASDNNFDVLYTRFAPLISKSFRWEYGAMSPYAAIPIGIYYMLDADHDKTDIFLQLALGVELDLEAFDNFTIVGEGGFDLKDSFSYVSIMGRFTF
ncbi:MAG: hypothetical protein M9899_06315 [Bdellovibrionaceae bacterium]|nr:hypothetical protein [Pseudobdellovibrionaceae bacterium]